MVPSWGLTRVRARLCPQGLSLRVHDHHHNGSRGVVSECVMFRHLNNVPLNAALRSASLQWALV